MMRYRRPEARTTSRRQGLPTPAAMARAFALALLSGGPILGFLLACLVAFFMVLQLVTGHAPSHGPSPAATIVSVPVHLLAILAVFLIGPVVGLVQNIVWIREAIPFAILVVAAEILLGPSRLVSAAVGGFYGVAFGMLGIDPGWAAGPGGRILSSIPAGAHPISTGAVACLTCVAGVIVGACLPSPCLMRVDVPAQSRQREVIGGFGGFG